MISAMEKLLYAKLNKGHFTLVDGDSRFVTKRTVGIEYRSYPLAITMLRAIEEPPILDTNNSTYFSKRNISTGVQNTVKSYCK